MGTSNKIYKSIEKKVKEDGGRMTNSRQKLIQYLSSVSTPQSISEIVKGSNLDEVGVYRNISYLASLGFVEEIHFFDGIKKFSLTNEHHDHIVCTNCGLVGHVPCDEKRLHVKVRHSSFPLIHTHSLTYYGLCAGCIK